MKIISALPILLLVAVPALAQPEIPSVVRDVHLIENGDFTYPRVPAHRTSGDGRVALSLAFGPRYFLFVPERLNTHATLGPAGVHLTSTDSPKYVSAGGYHNSSMSSPWFLMTTLCDPTPQFPTNFAAPRNPYVCPQDPDLDCYTMTFVGGLTNNSRQQVEIWGTPVTVAVRSPKTSTATIDSIQPGTPVKGMTYPYGGDFFEPMTTEDGRLLVVRLGGNRVDWRDENGAPRTGNYDIVYSAYDGGNPCDVTKWTGFKPISHAPYDPTINQKYGFARYPFLDTEGNVIPNGAKFKATYPWVDRKGKNIFFTTLGTALHYFDAQSQLQTRYPTRCVPGQSCATQFPYSQFGQHEDTFHRRGFAMIGLWSHGKTVLFDGMLNETDYGLRFDDVGQREVQLYQPNTGRTGQNQSGWVRVGGFDNNTAYMPQLGAQNSALLDSVENIFNYDGAMKFFSPRDVVWLMSNGKMTAEVDFDDYLDAYALIVADMNASMTYEDPNSVRNPIAQKHHDGFRYIIDGWGRRGSGFLDPIRLQNAATAPRFTLPTYGEAYGNVRIEPVAMGGVHGRGLWMDGQAVAGFRIPTQNLSGYDWFVSLFVDQREASPASPEQLLTFPNGGKVYLFNGKTLFYQSPTSQLYTTTFNAPIFAGTRRYVHLAWTIRQGGTKIDLYVNGFLFWRLDTGTAPLFDIQPGIIALGKVDFPSGVRGWLDEFKVIGRIPNPEEICNHARGYLVGMDSANAPYWSLAQAYPTAGHQDITSLLSTYNKTTHARYACVTDYLDVHGLPRQVNLTSTRRISQDVNFPESPLRWNLARPSSTQNPFCLSCHEAGMPDGLGLAALNAGTTLLVFDPRRQPTMAPAFMGGNLPAHYFGPNLPAQSMRLPYNGLQVVDYFLFP